MIAALFAFLAVFGMAESLVAETDLKPSHSEIHCFVECLNWCLWPEAPAP